MRARYKLSNFKYLAIFMGLCLSFFWGSCTRDPASSTGADSSVTVASTAETPGGSQGTQNLNKIKKPALTITTQGGRKNRFTLELARTPQERQRGLMYRRHLAEDRGMLFIFEDEQVRSFWMKNTLIHLDMIFIDSGLKVVGIVENAEPQTLTPRTVHKPSRFVLEIKGGLSKKLGMTAGDSLAFEGFSP